MKKEKKLVTIDEIIAGTATLEGNEDYVKTENGYILRPDLAEKVNADAKHRWENGGKEIHDKLMADPEFSKNEEHKNYFEKFEIPMP